MTVEERLEAIEKRCRRLRGCLVLILVLGVCAVLAGAAWQTDLGETVEAQAFVVRDTRGRIRAILSMLEDAPTYLAFYDARGNARIGVGMNQSDEPALSLFGPDGVKRAGLSLSRDSTALFSLYDAKEKPRVFLGVGPGEGAAVAVFDASGRATWGVTSR